MDVSTTDIAWGGVHILWAAGSGVWLWKRRDRLFVPELPAGAAAFPRALGWFMFAGAIAVWFGMATGAVSAQVLFKIGLDEYKTLRGMELVNAGGYVGGITALALLATMFWPLRVTIGRRPKLADVLRGLGAYAIAHPFIMLAGWAATLTAEAISGSAIDPLAHDTLRALNTEPVGPWWIGMALVAVVGAPILEEIVYRGLIQNGLLRLTRSPGAAIGIASFIFAFMHTSSVAPYALPILFVVGVCLGVAYNRTQSLLVSMVMHASFNALNLALLLWAS